MNGMSVTNDTNTMVCNRILYLGINYTVYACILQMRGLKVILQVAPYGFLSLCLLDI